MSHQFLDGVIYHKRFLPKEHKFEYKFFMVDIDLQELDSLKNRFFCQNSFNLFSFNTKNHFGKSDDFIENVTYLLKYFDIKRCHKMRFITLPSILGFVFNPISLLILFEKNIPTYLIAEVHNYNGGRVIYPTKLQSEDGINFKSSTKKDMYVSPFFKREGNYEFRLKYDEKQLFLNILLFEDEKKMLCSTLKLKPLNFSQTNILKLFFKHTFLTLWVVTRTLYQSFKLKRKGLKWSNPIKEDQIRRL
ncbi:DUF1365 domain-containing protein [Halarcobacter ebronensis]|uniref:DUF1365 domain-containing protein n=1 Tax=Halarcobacter ebronensis TaxID=1462615 RepID=A0A4Q1AGT3_9BACT|nr:DUF1365 domain-containing protein [Halarcobacter ebronensis]QKF82972.1 DUF1365 domain-containing protein [Halarcobacter ebronensis]RXK02830.1 DUF1365 domain-containing protein [Halarcobacter ebronensis]